LIKRRGAVLLGGSRDCFFWVEPKARAGKSAKMQYLNVQSYLKLKTYVRRVI